MKVGGLLAALAALCAAASAQGATVPVTRAQLALMPLPKSALGRSAAKLPLDSDSGVQTAKDAADNANGDVTGAKLTQLGYVTGYDLDYSDQGASALSRGHGLVEVDTAVLLYSSEAAAVRGIVFWRKDDTNLQSMKSAGMNVTLQHVTVPALGKDGFALVAKATIKGKPPFYALDSYFRSGAIIAELSIVAADRAELLPLATKLVPAYAARIAGVLSGRIAGTPVPLPGKQTQKAGPPPNGPPLDALALAPSDLGGGTVTSQGYRIDNDFDSISDYVRSLAPAGSFASLQEQVMFFHSSVEAGYAATMLDNLLRSPNVLKALGEKDIKSFHASPVAVKVGDESHAVLAQVGFAAGTVDEAILEIRVGRTMEFLVAAAQSGTVTPAAVVTLAQQAAQKAAAGLKK